MRHVAATKSVPSPSDGYRSVLDYNMTVLSVKVCLCAAVQGLASTCCFWLVPTIVSLKFCTIVPVAF